MKAFARGILLCCFLYISAWDVLGAQSLPEAPRGPFPSYTPLAWDEDWSEMRDRARQSDWSDSFHFVSLAPSAKSFASITGQIRERGEYQDHPAFGAQPPDNGYLLQRYLLSGDVHAGEYFRGFLQLDSGLIQGRDGGPRPGIDLDKLDINQGFIDLSSGERDRDPKLRLRSGRQLVSLGSTRLVAIGAGLNVEQPFDGFRLTARITRWTLTGIALRPTLTQPGAFDNRPNSKEELWGLYSTHGAKAIHSNVDLYYLGFDHKLAIYAQGAGREQRETVGARLWSHTPTWDYDFEYTGQFGRFRGGDIRAWGAGYHLAYMFKARHFAPHPEIDGGILSGDHNRLDNTLGTFNPLFPNGNYLGETILVGPYNLIIARPTFKLSLTPKLASNTNEEFLFREATQDGVYNVVGLLTHPAAGLTRRYIGSQFQEDLTYAFSRHLTGTLVYEHFFPGAFLKQSPPDRGVNFISPQLLFNF